MRLMALLAAATVAQAVPSPPVAVTVDNFPRAESDLNFSVVVKEAGLGKFIHQRAPQALNKQTAAHTERDLFVSKAVFDLDAGPVTITLPDAGSRFLSMQIVDEDAYTPEVDYAPARVTLSKEKIGARYALATVRILVNPDDPKDIDAAHALQDAIKVEQPGGPGAFRIPNWDAAGQVDVRTGLMVLAETLPDAKGMFGPRSSVDPVRRLIGSASAWGGAPQTDLLTFSVTPERNDGRTAYRLSLKDVPVDGFWSVSVYNARGFFDPNPQNAYSLDSASAKPGPDGTTEIQFGGCDGKALNCLPAPADWNYVLRLYRPRPAAFEGTWAAPAARPVS
ncbi:MAG: DUF1214 domain-containing protein [Hyphomicrobiales bacterium]|nr:DUF1214 domain-containing protein [Hyphomicrobiales bacterium]